nr:sulfite dehydrogenase [Desulfuromonadales bacterium]
MTRDRKLSAILSRRTFLSGSAMAGAAASGGILHAGRAAAANPENLPPHVPEWSQYLGAGVEDAPYGSPSQYEAEVVRRNVRWLTATTESSVNFTPLHALDGIVTPNGLCFERHHAGVADIDPSDHRLMIHGLVERPLIFTMEDLKRFPRMSRFYFLECAANGGMEWRGAQLNSCQFAHGMVHCVQYSGVSLATILNHAGLKPNAKWLLPEGADASGMTRSIPIEKALEDCMIAFAMNGEALRPEQGYPLRLVVPGFEGNMWVKWLRRIEVGDMPWHTREETSKYTDLLSDGTARRFTWVMDAKSVITNPCPENPVQHKGANVLTGLAWSGRGRIARVDVSLDGGKNWVPARLEEPVLPMCLTRFYYDWQWNGESVLLESRAMDETGYVQPTIEALRNQRGTNSIYHNNRIQTWLVNPSGEVENVQVS